MLQRKSLLEMSRASARMRGQRGSRWAKTKRVPRAPLPSPHSAHLHPLPRRRTHQEDPRSPADEASLAAASCEGPDLLERASVLLTTGGAEYIDVSPGASLADPVP